MAKLIKLISKFGLIHTFCEVCVYFGYWIFLGTLPGCGKLTQEKMYLKSLINSQDSGLWAARFFSPWIHHGSILIVLLYKWCPCHRSHFSFLIRSLEVGVITRYEQDLTNTTVLLLFSSDFSISSNYYNSIFHFFHVKHWFTISCTDTTFLVTERSVFLTLKGINIQDSGQLNFRPAVTFVQMQKQRKIQSEGNMRGIPAHIML